MMARTPYRPTLDHPTHAHREAGARPTDKAAIPAPLAPLTGVVILPRAKTAPGGEMMETADPHVRMHVRTSGLAD